jgi:hypothetical protein
MYTYIHTYIQPNLRSSGMKGMTSWIFLWNCNFRHCFSMSFRTSSRSTSAGMRDRSRYFSTSFQNKSFPISDIKMNTTLDVLIVSVWYSSAFNVMYICMYICMNK